jgi:hypothetical protein
MIANNMQIGGNHYAKGGQLQHWDLMDDYNVGYLEAAATKYVWRWADKDGVRDLRKADHFVKKLAEKRQDAPQAVISERIPNIPRAEINRFLAANKITGDEADIITHILTWQSTATLHLVRGRLQQLIQRVESESDEGADASIGYVNQDR